jgi:1-aminocyclopropane-1-carboxylate deaminase/D-cysteine desulfhydrase-like pyridoxal-dependent ACC family enzyme
MKGLRLQSSRRGFVLSAVVGALWRIEAVAVSRPAKETFVRAHLAAAAAAVIGCPLDLDGIEVFVYDNFLGAGYGIPSTEGQNAIAVTARAEGVFLDPTYTGKTMAVYRNLVSQGRYAGIETALFIHTGGAPSLFTAAVEQMA